MRRHFASGWLNRVAICSMTGGVCVCVPRAAKNYHCANLFGWCSHDSLHPLNACSLNIRFFCSGETNNMLQTFLLQLVIISLFRTYMQSCNYTTTGSHSELIQRISKGNYLDCTEILTFWDNNIFKFNCIGIPSTAILSDNLIRRFSIKNSWAGRS